MDLKFIVKMVNCLEADILIKMRTTSRQTQWTLESYTPTTN